MNRRIFLYALGVGALGVAGGCGVSLEDGIFNPCLSGPLPEHLRNHDVVRAAWDGVDPSQSWDCHAHIVGVGDGNTGVWITPQMSSPFHPWQSVQRWFYLNAACTEREGRVDEDFVRRIIAYLDAFPRGFKVMLLSFDFHYDDAGAKQEESSAFFVPDRYAAELARRFPDRCEWICSVHPARSDAVEALDWATKRGARAGHCFRVILSPVATPMPLPPKLEAANPVFPANRFVDMAAFNDSVPIKVSRRIPMDTRSRNTGGNIDTTFLATILTAIAAKGYQAQSFRFE